MLFAKVNGVSDAPIATATKLVDVVLHSRGAKTPRLLLLLVKSLIYV